MFWLITQVEKNFISEKIVPTQEAYLQIEFVLELSAFTQRLEKDKFSFDDIMTSMVNPG